MAKKTRKSLLKEFYILGHKWTINLVTMSSMPEGEIASCNPREKIITLCKDSPTLFADFIHEYGHAVWFESKLFQTSVHPDVVEVFVDQLGAALAECPLVAFKLR